MFNQIHKFYIFLFIINVFYYNQATASTDSEIYNNITKSNIIVENDIIHEECYSKIKVDIVDEEIKLNPEILALFKPTNYKYEKKESQNQTSLNPMEILPPPPKSPIKVVSESPITLPVEDREQNVDDVQSFKSEAYEVLPQSLHLSKEAERELEMGLSSYLNNFLTIDSNKPNEMKLSLTDFYKEFHKKFYLVNFEFFRLFRVFYAKCSETINESFSNKN